MSNEFRHDSLRDIRTLYIKEMKGSLRERNIVLFSLILPFVLYPTLLWAMLSAMAFVQGQEERMTSRIALSTSAVQSALVQELIQRIEENEKLEVRDEVPSKDVATSELRGGSLDLLVTITPSEGQLPGNYNTEFLYDESKDRSVNARARVAQILSTVRRDKYSEQATNVGIEPAAWKLFEVRGENVASGGEMGRMILSLLLPILLVVIISLGTMYPAIEATAGERERSTWETSLTLGTSRTHLVVAKYLHAATLATAAGLLNVLGMTLSIRTILAPLAGGSGRMAGMQFQLEPIALVVVVIGTALLALFLSGGMMILASFAKTFREGQSLVTPLYLASILPMVFMQAPDLELTPTLALIPIVNLLMVFREAINGIFQWPLIGVVLVVEIITIAACLWLATIVLRHEDFMVGSYEGSPVKFFQERVLRRRKATTKSAGGGE